MSQEVKFSVQLHIADDCSTDGTRGILRYYQHKYPELVVLNLARSRGLGRAGRQNNIKNVSSYRSADYIALLDGNIYWTDSVKTQHQLDFLEVNPRYSSAGYEAHRLDEVAGRIVVNVGDAREQASGPAAAEAVWCDLDQNSAFQFVL